MITNQLINEICQKIRENPGLTCHNLQNGVFVVKSGDKSCIEGEVRLSRNLEVDDVTYEIYVGGKEVGVEN